MQLGSERGRATDTADLQIKRKEIRGGGRGDRDGDTGARVVVGSAGEECSRLAGEAVQELPSKPAGRREYDPLMASGSGGWWKVWKRGQTTCCLASRKKRVGKRWRCQEGGVSGGNGPNVVGAALREYWGGSKAGGDEITSVDDTGRREVEVAGIYGVDGIAHGRSNLDVQISRWKNRERRTE